jgi:hypothetical protein
MSYVLIVLSGVYSVASQATVSTYTSERSCRTAGEAYVEQAAKAYPQDKFHFVCVPGEHE